VRECARSLLPILLLFGGFAHWQLASPASGAGDFSRFSLSKDTIPPTVYHDTSMTVGPPTVIDV